MSESEKQQTGPQSQQPQTSWLRWLEFGIFCLYLAVTFFLLFSFYTGKAKDADMYSNLIADANSCIKNVIEYPSQQLRPICDKKIGEYVIKGYSNQSSWNIQDFNQLVKGNVS